MKNEHVEGNGPPTSTLVSGRKSEALQEKDAVELSGQVRSSRESPSLIVKPQPSDGEARRCQSYPEFAVNATALRRQSQVGNDRGEAAAVSTT